MAAKLSPFQDQEHLLNPSTFNTHLNCPGRDPKSHAVFKMIPKKQLLELFSIYFKKPLDIAANVCILIPTESIQIQRRLADSGAG